DVVVAAQVVLEDAVLGQTGQDVRLAAEQGGVGGGHRMPGGAHGGDIVQHMALGFVGGAEVGGDPGRLHHHFAQQQDAGADDLADHPDHPHDGVDLGQVAAAGAQLLPDVGHRVQPHHVHPLVDKVEQVARHLVEDHRVCVIQVPLVGVKGG